MPVAVVMPAAPQQGRGLDAFGRAIQAYATIHNMNREDDADDRAKQSQEDANNNILTDSQQRDAQAKGFKISDTANTDDAKPFTDKFSGTTMYISPPQPKAELKPPVPEAYRAPDGTNKIGMRQWNGSLVTSPNDTLAPNQPKDPTEALDAANDKKQQRTNDETDKQMLALSDRLNPDVGRAKGNIRDTSKRDIAANRVIKFIDENPNPTPEQFQQIGEDVQAIYTGGAGGSEGRVKGLIPDTLLKDKAKFGEYLTGVPQSTDMTQFAQQLRGQAQSQLELGQKYVKDYQAKQILDLDGANWVKNDPQAMGRIADAAANSGLTIEDLQAARGSRDKNKVAANKDKGQQTPPSGNKDSGDIPLVGGLGDNATAGNTQSDTKTVVQGNNVFIVDAKGNAKFLRTANADEIKLHQADVTQSQPPPGFRIPMALPGGQ